VFGARAGEAMRTGGVRSEVGVAQAFGHSFCRGRPEGLRYDGVEPRTDPGGFGRRPRESCGSTRGSFEPRTGCGRLSNGWALAGRMRTPASRSAASSRTAALRREESRGGHFRLDYPERNDSLWKRRIMETVDGGGLRF